MNYKNVAIVLAIVMLSSIPIGMMGLSDDSDAYIEIDMGKVTASGFTNNGDGTISIPLKSTENTDIEITVRATYPGSDKVLGETTVTVPAGETVIAKITFNIPNVGDHTVRLECDHPEFFPVSPDGETVFNSTTVEVTVKESLWSKWTTYAAIALVIILIVIGVMLKMRGAPSKKPTTSFTELEKQRTGSEQKTIQPAKSATEKRRYSAPPASEKPSKIPEEPAKKSTTFTELSKEREAKPDKPSKKASSEEPKKIKYVSSRRK